MDNLEFQRQIATRLEKAQIRFERECLVDGFRADFIVFAPDERAALIETKSWHWINGNVARAGEIVSSIRERTGANTVFIVLENLDKNWPSKCVYKADGIVEGIQKWFREKTEGIVRHVETGRLQFSSKAPGQSKTLFAAMPFERRYEDTYWFAMTPAAASIGGEAIRVDQQHFTKQIIDQIKSDIAGCSILVADVSKSNPNVLYELGYARGQSKRCVQICSTSLRKLPFDVRGYPTIEYKLGSVSKLVPNLIEAVKKLAE